MDADSWLKIAALLFVVGSVGKRACLGPQKGFARLSVALVVLGFLWLTQSAATGDFNAITGAVLILAGMLVAIAMMLIQLGWFVRTTVLSRK